MPQPEPRWRIAQAPPAEEVARFSAEFELRPLAVSLAMQRGFADEAALGRYLHPRLQDLSDPFSLPGMESAVARLERAIEAKESIVLWGDYDVDGVSSLAMLCVVLREYGLDPHPFLPHRIDEGYGLNRDGLERLIHEREPTLIIAADCGTNSLEEASFVRDSGVDLIILDHHEPGESGVADCVALVNPKLGDSQHYLCTAGVVFKVAHALLKTRPLEDFDLRDILDLVALGTVADIVPLVDENRIFVRRGLQQLERTRRPGLIALKEVAGVGSPVHAMDIGFRLGPRLNAAGRLEDASAALDLLLEEDPASGKRLAQQLDERNRERQDLEMGTRTEAMAELERLPPEQWDSAIVVGNRNWHPGVVGIVASRLSREFYRPAVVIGFDESGLGKGSARSVAGISLVDALEEGRSLIVSGGGHELAAGLALHEENLDAFRRHLLAFSARRNEEGGGAPLTPCLDVDAVVGLGELDLELLESCELLRPFGNANPQPVLMCRAVSPLDEPRWLKQRHLKLRLAQGDAKRDAIWFNAPSHPLPVPPWDIAFTIDRNEWRGRSSLNIVIRGVRAADPA